MLISAIVAMAENRAIGKNNQLLWHLPADLTHFKQITWGKPIVMGRKTYQSIGRALPGRTNVIITRDQNFTAEGCHVAHSISDALATLGDDVEIMVIGGAELYQQMLPLTQKIYLTRIHHAFSADTFFPELSSTDWQEIERQDYPVDEKNNYAYSFIVLQRK